MIHINNILLSFYNFINPNSIIYKDNYILYNNSTYILQKVDLPKKLITNSNKFYSIIKNKYNNIFSLYNNSYYLLYKININKDNRIISFEDIIDISKTRFNCLIEKRNYYYIWKRKIEFLEKFFNNNYNKEDYDFYYYNAFANNALNLLKKINYYNITYGYSLNRFNNITMLYDLYDPIKIEYGPIVNSIAEYIKHEFFYNNREINYNEIFNVNFIIEDYYFLIARLLFPTYYYDLFKKKDIEEDYLIILNRIQDYNSYIRKIILEIKKRHNNMPLIDSIINLL